MKVFVEKAKNHILLNSKMGLLVFAFSFILINNYH